MNMSFSRKVRYSYEHLIAHRMLYVTKHKRREIESLTT